MSKTTRRGAEGADVLTAGEVARWLRVPKSTLYKLYQERKIPAKKVGRHWRFDREAIRGWFAGNSSDRNQPTDDVTGSIVQRRGVKVSKEVDK